MSGLDASTALDAASLVVAVSGVAIAGLAWLATRRWRPAVPLLLDFLLAAGLCRLSADDGWRTIGAAGALVAVRALVSRAGTQTAAARSAAGAASR